MNKILGSFIFFMSVPIFALSTASVNQSWFYPDDKITLTLSSDGNNVIFPNIKTIDKQPVLYTSNSQKIRIINNKRSRKSSRSYTFSPKKSLVIPAYTLMVDKVKQTTKAIKIVLKKPVKTKSGDDYILQVKIDKNDIFLGDEIKLSVIFKEKKSLTSNKQVNIIMPEVKDLLFIKNQQSAQTMDKKYNIHTLNYQLRANNFGDFIIPSVVASIGGQNNSLFANFLPITSNNKIIKIYSNSFTIKVRPLPNALRIFGDFNIKASVDKTKVKSGGAVNLVLSVQGSGNFEDIENFSVNIDKSTIYNDEPEFNHKQWQQKFAIISEQDFVIPSFSLDYFDKITQTKKHISTQAISVEVENVANKQALTKIIDTNPDNITEKTITRDLKYYYLLFGVVFGIMTSVLFFWFNNKKSHQSKNLINQIRLARNDKALFDLLLPLNQANLEIILQQLEANIYKNSQYKIRKKDIINAIKFEHKTH